MELRCILIIRQLSQLKLTLITFSLLIFLSRRSLTKFAVHLDHPVLVAFTAALPSFHIDFASPLSKLLMDNVSLQGMFNPETMNFVGIESHEVLFELGCDWLPIRSKQSACSSRVKVWHRRRECF